MRSIVFLTLTLVALLFAWTWDAVGPEGGIAIKVSPSPYNLERAYSMSMMRVFKTEDASSWDAISLRGSPRDILATSSLQALIVTDDSLYYSNDGGNTWTDLMSITNGGVFSENRDTLVFLLANNILYRSTDGGFNWLQIAPFGYDNPTRLEYSPSNPDILYAAVETEGDSALILKSSDGGSTWSIVFIPSDSLYIREIYDIEVNPWNENEVFLSPGLASGPVGLIYSNDGGTNWTTIPGSPGTMILTPTDVEFISPDTILVTNYIPQKIYRGVRTGGEWTFEEFAALPNPMELELGGDTLYVATTRGVYVSFDGGLTFDGIFDGFRALAIWREGQLSQLLNERLYLTDMFFGCTVYYTLNGGINWSTYMDTTWIFTSAVEIAPSNPLTVYASAMGVEILSESTYIFHTLYRSDDGGMTFHPVDTVFNPDSAFTATDLWVSSSDPERLLMYSDETNTILISLDGGITWTQVMDSVSSWKYGFVGEGDTVFFYNENNGTILRSVDGGESFEPFLSNIYDIAGYTYDPNEEELFYLRGSFLYRVLPDGTVADSFEIPYLFGGSITVGHDNTLYFSGFSYGFFIFGRTGDDGLTIEYDTLDFFPGPMRASSQEIIISEMGASLRRSVEAVIGVDEIKISHPGVSLPTVVRGYLPVTGLSLTAPLRVSIYDVAGRLVLRSILENRNAIPLGGLRSGVYFIRLKDARGKKLEGKIVKISE